MALSCLIRSVPRALSTSGKYYFVGGQLTRSASTVCGVKFRDANSPSQTLFTATRLAPLCLPKLNSIDVQHVKEFSVTPRNQSSAGSDYSKLWSAEKILSASLLAVLPTAFIFPSQAMDTLMAISLVMHNHWGIEAIVVDYVRSSVFGPVIPKVAVGLTYALSIATLVGLLTLTYNGAGFVNTIMMFWKI